MPTTPTHNFANDCIVIPTEDMEDKEGFVPRNSLPRSPKQHVMKPAHLPDLAEGLSTENPSGDRVHTNQTDSEITKEPTMEEALKALQSVHDLLSQKTLRAEQKNDARNKIAWAIELIKAMHAPTTQIQNGPKEEVHPTACPTIAISAPQDGQQNTSSIENDIKDIKALLKEALAPKPAWTQGTARA